MTISMTGFAAARSQAAGYQWTWDIRSVNGKGLELRLRVPEWIEGLEASLRAELQKSLGRGNVSLSLRLTKEESDESNLRINSSVLSDILKALSEVKSQADRLELTLTQASTAEVLSMRGVMEIASAEPDIVALRHALMESFYLLLEDFKTARASEGKALHNIIIGQVDQIEALVLAAAKTAQERRPQAAAALEAAIARLGANIANFDPARVAQELALLAVKQDIAEELDRLDAHIKAARHLLAQVHPVGRKLDFLMQEFLREANTLLSKSQDIMLSQIGLDLKTVIDQMREQVQNVE